MTNRIKGSRVWASGGTAVDPDLDTKHVIFQPGKYLKGWIVEKEPHTWQNFITQVTDLKLLYAMQEYITVWQSDVAYKSGALVRLDDVIYRNVSGRVSANEIPTSTSGIWSSVLSMTVEGITSSVAALNTKISEHKKADNPHEDTIGAVGGYPAEDIFKMYADPNDPRTIVSHKNMRGVSAHRETPQQLGMLPATGGTFTGDVVFKSGLTLASYGTLFESGGTASLGHIKGSIAIPPTGRATIRDSSGATSEITTVDNFNKMQMEVNNEFALLEPLYAFMFENTLSSLYGGSCTMEYTNAQVFDNGWVVADGVSVYDMTHSKAVTVAVLTDLGFLIKDLSSLNVSNLKTFILSVVPNAKIIKRLCIYPQLTSRQKLSMVIG